MLTTAVPKATPTAKGSSWCEDSGKGHYIWTLVPTCMGWWQTKAFCSLVPSGSLNKSWVTLSFSMAPEASWSSVESTTMAALSVCECCTLALPLPLELLLLWPFWKWVCLSGLLSSVRNILCFMDSKWSIRRAFSTSSPLPPSEDFLFLLRFSTVTGITSTVQSLTLMRGLSWEFTEPLCLTTHAPSSQELTSSLFLIRTFVLDKTVTLSVSSQLLDSGVPYCGTTQHVSNSASMSLPPVLGQ